MQYLCESITLHDAVLDPVHLQVHGEVEVFPQVKDPSISLWQTLAFDAFSLRYPRILHCRLHDAHGVVLEVVVNDHGSDAVVLLGGVEDVLLEVPVETQHLQHKAVVMDKKTRVK